MQELSKTIAAATAAIGDVAAAHAGVEQILADFRVLETAPNDAPATIKPEGGEPSNGLLVVSPAEASALLGAVKRGCGPAWSTVLSHIGPLMSALAAGGVTVSVNIIDRLSGGCLI